MEGDELALADNRPSPDGGRGDEVHDDHESSEYIGDGEARDAVGSEAVCEPVSGPAEHTPDTFAPPACTAAGFASAPRNSERPTSAEIADLIEGYHDDFMEMPAVDSTGIDSPRRSQASGASGEASLQDAAPDYEVLIEMAHTEHQHLLAWNGTLQRHVRSVLEAKSRSDGDGENQLGTAEARYVSLRHRLAELRATVAATQAQHDHKIEDLRLTLQERMDRTATIQKALRHFIVEVGKGCEYAATGRPIKPGLVERLHRQDLAKEEALVTLRLKSLELRNRLGKLERTVKQREELAEGLHLLDFEQLKIENQSLNEKIEERVEELTRLKRKTTVAVQILTHMREKLQYVRRQVDVLTREVSQLESENAARREALTRVKTSRDRLRSKVARIRDASLLMDNPMLIADMHKQYEARAQLLSEVEDMEDKLQTLASRASQPRPSAMSTLPRASGSKAAIVA